MAFALPKLEGKITVPAAGFSITATDSGGSATVLVLAAGDYYPNSTTSFMTAIGTALTASATLAGTYTFTSDDGSITSTGKTTITVTGGGASVTISWPDTTLRNILGFTATLSGAATYLSPNACQYIFLPDVKRMNPIGPDGIANGCPMTDATVTISPSGKSKVLKYATRYIERLEFGMLSGGKTWTGFETNVNESLQSFWLLTLGAGVPVRYHYDRSNDSSFNDWRCVNPQMFMVKPEFGGFVGTTGSDGTMTRWHFGPVDMIQYV